MGFGKYFRRAIIVEKAATAPFHFIDYDGSDEVCQITAVFKRGEPLVIWLAVKIPGHPIFHILRIPKEAGVRVGQYHGF